MCFQSNAFHRIDWHRLLSSFYPLHPLPPPRRDPARNKITLNIRSVQAMGTTRNMFHIFELAKGDNYDAPPSKASLALCMAVAKRLLSKSTNVEITDMICSYGCEATEEDVEAAALEKTGLRTPWLKFTLHESVESFEDKAGIVTWEMVPEVDRTIMEKLECLKVAVGYMAERGFDVVPSFSFSFQIVDPDDEVDDDAIADMVYLETGIRT